MSQGSPVSYHSAVQRPVEAMRADPGVPGPQTRPCPSCGFYVDVDYFFERMRCPFCEETLYG